MRAARGWQKRGRRGNARLGGASAHAARTHWNASSAATFSRHAAARARPRAPGSGPVGLAAATEGARRAPSRCAPRAPGAPAAAACMRRIHGAGAGTWVGRAGLGRVRAHSAGCRPAAPARPHPRARPPAPAPLAWLCSVSRRQLPPPPRPDLGGLVRGADLCAGGSSRARGGSRTQPAAPCRADSSL